MKFKPERAVCMAFLFASFEEYYKGCIPMEYTDIFNLADRFAMFGADNEVEYMLLAIVDGVNRTRYEREHMLKEYTRFIRVMEGSAPLKELRSIRREFEEYYAGWDQEHNHNWDGHDWKICPIWED